MVGLAGTSYVGKQYRLCFKSSKGYLPDDDTIGYPSNRR
nr:MAG TPA: hypothetical protein [Caudoviricetes sp.]